MVFLFSFWHPYDLYVGMFKVVPEAPKTLLIFCNSCFFILFCLNVYFFLLFQIVDLSPGFLPFTVGSLYIFLYFTLYSLHFFLHFVSVLISVSILITSVLNSESDRLATSSSLSSFFWSFDLFFHLDHISLSWCTCYIIRSGALGIC